MLYCVQFCNETLLQIPKGVVLVLLAVVVSSCKIRDLGARIIGI